MHITISEKHQHIQSHTHTHTCTQTHHTHTHTELHSDTDTHIYTDTHMLKHIDPYFTLYTCIHFENNKSETIPTFQFINILNHISLLINSHQN